MDMHSPMTPKNIPVPHYGGGIKGKCPLEAVEQISFFNRLRSEYPETWGLLAVHIRNEDGSASAQKVRRMKLDGLVTGASDIQIPGCPSLVLEMKRADPAKSTLSSEQARYLIAAQNAGAFACVAFGAEGAWSAFQEWLSVQRI